MKARLNYSSVAPDGYKAMLGLEEYLEHCSLEPSLKLLVLLRASQINHCAYCIDMHSQDLRAIGESEQRLYLLNAWREAPFYSSREKAALAWTDAVTSLSPGFVPDEVYEAARKEFSEKELVDLTLALATINGWNRLCVAFRSVPGHYKPSVKVEQEVAAVSNA